MSEASQQLFIAVRGFLVLLGTDDLGELVLFDPGIRAVVRNKVAYSADTGRRVDHPENFVSQSSTKSVLSYFNVHAKEAAFKNGTQEKLDCLSFNSDGSLCLGGSLNGNLFIWSSFTGDMLCKLKISIGGVKKIHVDRYLHFEPRHDQRLVILTTDNKVLIYDFDQMKHLIDLGQIDTSNLKPLFSLSPHKKPILDMVVPLGRETHIFTLSLDNTVKVVDISTGDQSADIFLEDMPSCFCTDFIGNCVFVGFNDGRIRRYNYLHNAKDLTLEKGEEAHGFPEVHLESQQAKVLFDVRHKTKVTSIMYVPEVKELVSSGADEMLFMFTPSGVSTFTTGKFKRSFDFMQLVQRPSSFYISSHFGSSITKTKMVVKQFNKTTVDQTAGGPRIRTFLSLKDHQQTASDKTLIDLKQAKKVASCLLDVFSDCQRDTAPLAAPNSKAPVLQKREIEELESEISELKKRLDGLAGVNKLLMKRIKQE